MKKTKIRLTYGGRRVIFMTSITLFLVIATILIACAFPSPKEKTQPATIAFATDGEITTEATTEITTEMMTTTEALPEYRVVYDPLNLRKSPEINYDNIITQLNKGDVITVEEDLIRYNRNGYNWVYIHSDLGSGWVVTAGIEVIK